MKKLLFNQLGLVIIVLMVLGAVSCLETGDGSYSSSNYTMPAIIGHNSAMGGTTLITNGGELAAPNLNEPVGNTVIAHFTVDSKAQVSSEYVLATDVTIQDQVAQTRAAIVDSVAVDEYVLPVKGMELLTANGIILKGWYFFNIAHEASNNQAIEYKLVADTKDVDAKDIHNVYLLAKKVGESGAATTSTTARYHTFNISNFVQQLGGRDTTINQTVHAKYVKLNVKYIQEIKDGEPVYKTFNSNPFEFFIPQ